MLFRQLFDHTSYTYTYLIGDEQSRKAVLIDPVKEKIDLYETLVDELELTLIHTLDTHTHADHISAMGQLRQSKGCRTLVGAESESKCVDYKFRDNERIAIGELSLVALHTPGHTNDSYCFYLIDKDIGYLFTGDTLLIRGSGRTDFQLGNAKEQYQSIFNRLLTLPGDTFVYPGHDYKGQTVSTIDEEKKWNPRLQVSSAEEYSELMGNLKLPNPALMDIAVPANIACGEK